MAILPSKTAQNRVRGSQQRVPGLNIKEYFYAVDLIKLRALNKGKDRS